MFLISLAIGILLLLIGSIVFLVDAFRIHWLWAVGSIFVPFVNLVCLAKHWAETKRGFLISLFAIPFLVAAFLNAPNAAFLTTARKGESANDPFINAINRAKAAVAKVEASRQIAPPIPQSTATPLETPATTAAVPAASVAPTPAPTPKLTLSQKFARNRAEFDNLKIEFAALEAKRKALPKNDRDAIAAFNLEAKAYAARLAAARSEQATLKSAQR